MNQYLQAFMLSWFIHHQTGAWHHHALLCSPKESPLASRPLPLGPTAPVGSSLSSLSHSLWWRQLRIAAAAWLLLQQLPEHSEQEAMQMLLPTSNPAAQSYAWGKWFAPGNIRPEETCCVPTWAQAPWIHWISSWQSCWAEANELMFLASVPGVSLECLSARLPLLKSSLHKPCQLPARGVRGIWGSMIKIRQIPGNLTHIHHIFGYVQHRDLLRFFYCVVCIETHIFDPNFKCIVPNLHTLFKCLCLESWWSSTALETPLLLLLGWSFFVHFWPFIPSLLYKSSWPEDGLRCLQFFFLQLRKGLQI